jgi:hypothetical protein
MDLLETCGNDVVYILATYLVFNLVTFVIENFGNFVYHVQKASEELHSRFNNYVSTCSRYLGMGLTFARCGWILFRIKYLKYQVPIPKPTITIEKVKTRLYLTYTYNDQTYKMILSNKRGPSSVVELREGDKDVSALITPYLGPNSDWHGIRYTPHQLGLQSLTVLDIFGEEKTFTGTDTIIF